KPPGPIRNSQFLKDNGQPRAGMIRGQDYRGINANVWNYLHGIYGGGPVFVRATLDLYAPDPKTLSLSSPRNNFYSQQQHQQHHHYYQQYQHQHQHQHQHQNSANGHRHLHMYLHQQQSQYQSHQHQSLQQQYNYQNMYQNGNVKKHRNSGSTSIVIPKPVIV
ncbi:hypothetical protein BX616_007434, partial [Lobosporangium transversale]